MSERRCCPAAYKGKKECFLFISVLTLECCVYILSIGIYLNREAIMSRNGVNNKLLKKRNTKTRRPSVSPRDFVVAWQTGETIQEVAEATGMTETAASRRASSYRKRGVSLKLFRRGRGNTNWAALSELAQDVKKRV